MNKVILVGRIGKDPEVFTFESGDKKSSFSVATSEKYKDKKSGEWRENTEWHNVVLFRETKLKKGDLIELEGKVTTRSWDDKDGNKKYMTEIVARTAGLLNRKHENQTTSPNQDGLKEQSRPSANNPDVPEDDLPF